MRTVLTVLFALGLTTCEATQQVQTTTQSGDFVVRRKIVEFSPLKQEVVGLPASNLGLPYYYNVRALSDEELADRIAEKVAQKLLAAQPEPEEPEEVEPEPEPTEEPEDKPKPKKPTKVTAIQKIFQNKCVNCHGTTPKNNELVLVKEDGAVAEIDARMAWHIFDRTAWISDLPEDARMPKNGEQLTEEELLELMKWARNK